LEGEAWEAEEAYGEGVLLLSEVDRELGSKALGIVLTSRLIDSGR
jgi:hypothetical protein